MSYAFFSGIVPGVAVNSESHLTSFLRPVTQAITSHADSLRLVTRSSPRGGTRDEPENVCVGG